jgi:hypothetical protein
MVFGDDMLERATRHHGPKDYSSADPSAVWKAGKLLVRYVGSDVGDEMMIDGCTVGLPNIHGPSSTRVFPCLEGSNVAF